MSQICPHRQSWLKCIFNGHRVDRVSDGMEHKSWTLAYSFACETQPRWHFSTCSQLESRTMSLNCKATASAAHLGTKRPVIFGIWVGFSDSWAQLEYLVYTFQWGKSIYSFSQSVIDSVHHLTFSWLNPMVVFRCKGPQWTLVTIFEWRRCKLMEGKSGHSLGSFLSKVAQWHMKPNYLDLLHCGSYREDAGSSADRAPNSRFNLNGRITRKQILSHIF